MSSQNPAPNDDASTAAIKAANAVRDAFSIGWSIQELRNRVLLEALDTGGNGTPKPQSTLDEIISALEKTVFLTSSNLQAQDGLASSNKGLNHISRWRSLFVRIAATHCICFPASTLINTPYDPAPAQSLATRYPYLYPSGLPSGQPSATSDYALVGIRDTGNNATDEASLLKFSLYDVARRSLNCLTLLCTEPDDGQILNIIYDYQQQIVASLTENTPSQRVPVSPPGDTLSEEQKEVQLLQKYMSKISNGSLLASLKTAKQFFSILTVGFLDSWDGFLRENFYVGGQLKNNELELLAYEAGRSLASLSFGTSLMLKPLEDACNKNLNDENKLNDLVNAWTNIFDDSFINTVDRQISALGPTLDDGYYALKNVPRPAARERPAPEVPSRAIHAITYNLLYWQRTIKTLPQSPSKATVDTWQQLRCQTLVEQSGIWQSLMLGEQTLRSFSTERVTKKIMNDIMSDLETAISDQSRDALRRYRTQVIIVVVLLLLILAGFVFLAQNGQLQSITTVVAVVVGGVVTFVSAALTRIGSAFSPTANGKTPTAGASANAGSIEQSPSGVLGATESAVASIFQNAYKQILIEFDDLNHYVAISYPLVDFFTKLPPEQPTPSTPAAVAPPVQTTPPVVASPVVAPAAAAPAAAPPPQPALLSIIQRLLQFLHLWSAKEIAPVSQELKDLDKFLMNIVWTGDEREEEVMRIARAAFGPLGLLITSPAKKGQTAGNTPPAQKEQPTGNTPPPRQVNKK